MINFIVGAVILLIVGAIVGYLIRARRRGETCIGCPYAKQCSGKCGGHCEGSAAHGKEQVENKTSDTTEI